MKIQDTIWTAEWIHVREIKLYELDTEFDPIK